jgi:uncharacterized LabA/DUF88 family protein
MTRRVVVFIDAQNLYQGAREAFFGSSGSHTLGQFNPLGLAQLVVSRKPVGDEGEPRELSEVRVYTGRPDSTKDPKTYGAHRRQCAAWEKLGVKVVARTLRYPRKWPAERAQEKGIDVALAVDFVVMAVEGEYDVGVIASTDTDLRPPLEYVLGKSNVHAEVASWHGRVRAHLSVPGRRVWCHRLHYDDYEKVADYTDYNLRP